MRRIIFTPFFILWSVSCFGQTLNKIYIDKLNKVDGCRINQKRIEFPGSYPLFSFKINDKTVNASEPNLFQKEKIRLRIEEQKKIKKGLYYKIIFENHSSDTVKISDLIPFCKSEDKIYITSTGPWALARAKLFRPHHGPISVTLPDNAWELGYASFKTNNEFSLCALIRRIDLEKSKKYRYKTMVYPEGSLSFDLHIEVFKGNWQNGLKLIFQKKYLYDLDKFDNTLYQRDDLKWIGDAYLINLIFAWDHNFYDYKKNKYKIFDFLHNAKKYFGKYDILGLWPTWPRLGVDERNQWDMYRDLPGGLKKIKEISKQAQKQGTKFFISYNPWDKSTRYEDPYKGMASLIKNLEANGVVLDCKGSSSIKLQNAADRVKSGVIMYSEGMAVIKDMPGIISGRVHDAIYLQPPLNLNKLIKPDFSIFRVCQLNEGRLHRETSISFFNGYGTEINTFAPGRPQWMDEEYNYLGKTLKILRENTSVFHDYSFTPLINSLIDSIWVNKWNHREKIIFTILSFNPKGHAGPLFEVETSDNVHFVSIWNHEELLPVPLNNKTYIPVEINSFNENWLSSRKEANIDCIAQFHKHLNIKYFSDSLKINSTGGDSICIWKEECSYKYKPLVILENKVNIRLAEKFGTYEGKLIIQLFNDGELSDERIIFRKAGNPVLISKVPRTRPSDKVPENMIKIPAAEFIFYSFNNANFIPNPENSDSSTVKINEFYIDKFPVTNKQYFRFIKKIKYQPDDITNYLKHWKNGKYKKNDADKPVVYLSLKDTKAYAEWAGKRLPTEAEWQYAAQSTDNRKWPWGSIDDSTKFNISGRIIKVGQHPEAASPFGVQDLVGNVWQFTNDVYDNGSYYFVMIRGGSYYNPTSSWWYVKGGPQKLFNRQKLLLISPGFNRNATIGFRCVKDVY